MARVAGSDAMPGSSTHLGVSPGANSITSPVETPDTPPSSTGIDSFTIVKKPLAARCRTAEAASAAVFRFLINLFPLVAPGLKDLILTCLDSAELRSAAQASSTERKIVFGVLPQIHANRWVRSGAKLTNCATLTVDAILLRTASL